MAEENQIMTMQKWIEITDELLKFRKKNILDNEGNISHKQAIDKANDENKNPRYACCRATNSSKYVNEASGSDKKFSFRLLSKEVKNTVHLFESAIDLLSYATLLKEKGLKWYEENLISLAVVYQSANNILNSKIPKAIDYFLCFKKSKKTNEIRF